MPLATTGPGVAGSECVSELGAPTRRAASRLTPGAHDRLNGPVISTRTAPERHLVAIIIIQ